MGQWLRALDILPEAPESVPSTHMASHTICNSSPLMEPLGTACIWYTDIHADKHSDT